MNFNARLANNLSRVSALCALLVAGLAAAVLTSWSLGRWQLGAFGADYVPMAPSTAVALLLLSSAVLLVGRWPGRAVVYYAYIVVAAVAALSVVILLQGPADFELSPEKWLSRTNELVGGIPVGRMSPMTALSFLLAVLALLFWLPPFSRKRALEHAANLLAAGVALTGLVMVLGYATGTPLLYGAGTIPMAWTTTVAFTLLGLALLGARPDTVLRYFADEVMLLPSRGNAHRREWLLPRLFIVLAVAIGMTGFFYLRRQQALGRQTAMKGLSVIADLKAAQIADWCRERLADADEMLFNVPTLAPALQSFLADQGKRDARDRLDRWIQGVRAHKAYERVVVLDRLGRVRLVDPPGDGEINPQLLSEIAVARRNRRVTLGDLQAHPSKPRLGLPVLVPIFLPANTARREDDGFVGAIVLEMNPSQYLFPAIQTWPTPSATAETLLVRLDGANVLFLNELRHRKNTALSLRRPLSDPRLPAAIGLRGEAAAVEGVDYRGEPVLAVMRRVPNTAWMIVAKVDQAEIYAPLRLEALSVGAVVALLLLALALGSMNVRRRELTKLMQRDLALERERNAMAERLAYLTKYANDMMLFTDQDWRIVDANDRAVKAYGYSDEELQRLTLRDLQAPESRETFDQHARQLHVQNGMIVESVHQRKDGSTFPVESSMRAVEFEGQHFHQSIIRNITERKRAEEAQERLVAILEATTDFVATAAADGQVLYYNRAARQLLGIREDEDISNTRIPHTHPEWANRIVLDEGIPSAVRDGVWSGETALLSRDGKEIPVSQVILAHKAPDGTVEFLSTIARDITERKQADATRQALYRASLQIQEPLGLQERLNRLLQTAQTVLALDRITVLLADKEGQELRAVASLGVDEPLDAIRVPIGAAGGALAEAYRTHQMIIWDGRLPLPERLRLQSPYDEIAALRSRVFAIVPLVVQGRAIGVLGVDRKHSPRALEPAMLELLQLFASQAALAIEHGRLYEEQRMAAIQLEARVEDRTRELQAANAQLQEATHQAQAASRHKSMFLANMSHELRTPLNAILGFSELLAQQTYGPLTEKQARYVDNVHTSGQHLLALINDLLDLSKVEAGKLELQPQAFHLREALEAALHVLRPQAEAKQQALRLQVADELSALTADPLRVRQILYNLLSNAVKFTPAGGSITVTARRVPSFEFHVPSSEPGTWDLEPGTARVTEFVEIVVADTGIGIKPEDLPKLFQPFTQLEQTFTKQAQGTGLGLALTKHLVELHGGTIRAESAGEGRGSTFTICLPLPSHAS